MVELPQLPELRSVPKLPELQLPELQLPELPQLPDEWNPVADLTSAAADAVANIPPLDGIDALLLTPLLVPVLGAWALGATASAANATAGKFFAEMELGRVEKANTLLKKQLAESEERYERKMTFWKGKVASDKKESLEILRRAKDELRQKLRVAEEKLAAAQRAPVQPPPPPPAPTLKELEAELDLGAALHAASEAFRAMPAVATKLAPGFVRLTPGISPGETVLVTGADGPIGKLVVAELLARCPGSKVRACGGSLAALEENLAELVGAAGDGAEAVELVQWDAITDPLAVGFDGVSAVVWCASSFGRQAPAVKEKEAVDVTQRLSQALSRFLPRPEALDGRLESGGVQRAASAFRASTALLAEDAPRITPKFVLLSSAAVTRPEWREEQRETFAEAYGIPIVGLNPGGILGFKLKGERALRDSGAPYCIVRPCAVNDEQPAGGRLVLSSGDLATGRICRADLARVLVDALLQPDALCKTFEVFSLPGLPAEPIASSLALLPADRIDGSPEPDPAAYQVLAQLKPGEKPMGV